MDKWLAEAPCGYLSISDDLVILAVNDRLLSWLGYAGAGLSGQPLDTLLPVPARILLQLYFLPQIRVTGKVDEMYLSLLTKAGGELPVILYAVRRETGGASACECMLLPMRRRQTYEHELLEAERAAASAKAELDERLRELEQTRQAVQAARTELQHYERLSAETAEQVGRANAELARLKRMVGIRQEALIRQAVRDNLAATEGLLKAKPLKDTE